MENLVIVGDSAFAEIAHEYFTHDSDYRVVGFSVDREYLKREQLCGLPVVPFDALETRFPPSEHALFVAVVYTQLNRLRARFVSQARQKGYRLASYISSRAFVWPNVKRGEHCFIFEHNVVQPFVTLGDDVILWSGNHIGHHSVVRDHCFLSSHVVLSGYCDIGPSCFLGVNASVGNNVTVGADCLIGAGALVLADTDANRIYGARATRPEPGIGAREYFGL
jgi:sugar O-acyltransferase (sialic acid O-acetyltransferase NeuD family)